ncbi:endo alpha-1,4 polygalactosaminidase [Herbiconiux sp.]|uniref:endo alpha-1,4 polygalactosaminidase n=1 Tax=Herbiconiux sp. TaxID=1871186 RepID=UPI0025C0F4FC|nr:endo alpha-1,4 polygalactosaminidase [Herbiconiux sp.]
MRRGAGTIAVATALLVGVAGLAGCATGNGGVGGRTGEFESAEATPGTEAGASSTPGTTSGGAAVPLLPDNAVVDYQLGGGYPPSDGVTVVARDSTDEPAEGLYSICYLNGFQTQPGADWPDELVLHDASGAEVFDPGWPDERLLDISTADKREAIAERFQPAIAGCRADGFQAVEFDNLDSYTRSDGAFGVDDAVGLATLLVASAHTEGLAAGQKNTAELADRGRTEIGFDFAVTEECRRFDECATYTDVYGAQVIDIEYTDDLGGTVAEVCADPQLPPASVIRDRDLVPAGAKGHVEERC